MEAAFLPSVLPITIYAGDDMSLDLEVCLVDPITGAETLYDFTGASAAMHLKSRPEDSAASAVLKLTSAPPAGLSFPVSSQIRIEVTSAQSAALPNAALWYDLQVTDSLGKVRTFFSGSFTTKKDVTR